MKKKQLFLIVMPCLAVMALVVFGCKKEDDAPPSVDMKLISLMPAHDTGLALRATIELTNTNGNTVTEFGVIANGSQNHLFPATSTSKGTYTVIIDELPKGNYNFMTYAHLKEVSYPLYGKDKEAIDMSQSSFITYGKDISLSDVSYKITYTNAFHDSITELGICYSSTNNKPVITDNKTEYTLSDTSFIEITDDHLVAGELAYIRPYFTLSNGTIYYGNTFSDFGKNPVSYQILSSSGIGSKVYNFRTFRHGQNGEIYFFTDLYMLKKSGGQYDFVNYNHNFGYSSYYFFDLTYDIGGKMILLAYSFGYDAIKNIEIDGTNITKIESINECTDGKCYNQIISSKRLNNGHVLCVVEDYGLVEVGTDKTIKNEAVYQNFEEGFVFEKKSGEIVFINYEDPVFRMVEYDQNLSPLRQLYFF